MVEELIPYNIEVRYVPGKNMEFPDHGSRYPISHGEQKLFDTELGSLGICVRSRRVQSVDVKDPKFKILARVAMEDHRYLRDIELVVQQTDLDHLGKDSELRQLRSCWNNLSVVTLDSGKLIIRKGRKY